MIKRRWFLVVLIGVLLLLPTMVMASSTWNELARTTWETYKSTYIFCGANCGDDLGLVFDPEIGYQATSESAGYGLLMAVMMDDQPTFDTIINAAVTYMLNPDTGLLHWRANNTGGVTGEGSATDADQDIAVALIFAQSRVDDGSWYQPEGEPYAERARAMLNAIWDHAVYEGRYVAPGDLFPGDGQQIINLSYFAPAWYRIFDDFEGAERWAAVIDQGYQSLLVTEGSPRGLAPDWSTAEGAPALDFCAEIGQAAEQCSYQMRYDAIRVPFRIGLDCLWFGEPRACEWSQTSVTFLRAQPNGAFARMYDMQGTPVVDYQDVAMTSMWLVAGMAADASDVQSRLEERLLTSAANVWSGGYWDDSPQSYYKQSLAWFGVALLSGDFWNIA